MVGETAYIWFTIGSLAPGTVPKTCVIPTQPPSLSSDVDMTPVVLAIKLEYIRISLILYFSISILFMFINHK